MIQTVLLGDLIEIKHGYAFKGEYFSDTPTNNILVTPGNFTTGGGFKQGKLKYYDGPIDGAYVLNPNGVIVTMTDLSKAADTLGFSARVPSDEGKIYLHNQRIGLATLKSDTANLDYIYWLMRSNNYRRWVVSGATGSTVKHTAPSKILGYKFDLPVLETQKKIADILGTIDEKIELNRQMNETLEHMGQALFRHYFINNPEAEKWEEVPLSELCQNISSGGTPSTRNESYYGGDVLWFSTKELQDGFLFGSDKTITDDGLAKSAAKLFPINTVTMAIYAAPTVGRLGILTKEASFNQATCGLVAKPEIGYEFIYLCLLLSRVELNNMANGAAQQNISVGKVRDFKVLHPSIDSLGMFRTKIEPIFEQIKNSSEQIQTLTTLRDTLLPRLISGKMRV